VKAVSIQPVRITVADADERHAVYSLRHGVYCTELGQYAEQPDGSLPDSPDVESVYIVASRGDDLVGFVGVTPPQSPSFSTERHLQRQGVPLSRDQQTFEIRALTVDESARGSVVAMGLMYAAFRWIQARGGLHIVAIGRREAVDMYLRLGLQRAGTELTCGDVIYDLMLADVDDIAATVGATTIDSIERRVDWQMDIAFRSPAECYHGGAFFDAIGDGFDRMDKVDEIINADVLDAWFPPAPAAVNALRDRLPWIMRTSPPNHADGLVRAIADARGVDPACILTGGGSSALIFRAFGNWLTRSSRVLVLDPTYGEYFHVLERVVRCETVRFSLDRSDGYQLDSERLAEVMKTGFDLFVWVNPNSPTGRHMASEDAAAILETAAACCRRVWIDETYVEYAGPGQSLEQYAVRTDNVIVCKSMSKVYALSGMRVAYLCAPPQQLESLRALTPPWSVGLAAQIAATHALQAGDYYKARYAETHDLRQELVAGLRRLGIRELVPGIANFVMFHLPASGKNARTVIDECRERGLFLRGLSEMGAGDHALRIAVKDADTNHRMLAILADILH
jgi:histidinol-phosphate/aromatic aminotransferase/cobyric acid decarboxylase-like protein